MGPPRATCNVVLTRVAKGSTVFRSRPLLLITEQTDAAKLDPDIADRMLHARKDDRLNAALKEAPSFSQMDALSQAIQRRFPVHVLLVSRYEGKYPNDPNFEIKKACVKENEAQALHIFERIGLLLDPLRYPANDRENVFAFPEGGHYVQVPWDSDDSVITPVTMAEMAKKYPKRKGCARVFVVANIPGDRGVAWPPGAVDTDLADSCFIDAKDAFRATMTHELGHLLDGAGAVKHYGSAYNVMMRFGRDARDYTETRWINYLTQITRWLYEPRLTAPL